MADAATPPPGSTRLTVLGSGDAFSGCGCNAAYLVDDRVLVDCGAPVQVLLPRAGVAVASLDVVLVTHFHADHTFMLPVLLGARAFTGELRPGLVIAGPPGTREYVVRLLRTGYGHHLVDLIEARVQPLWVTLQDGMTADLAGYSITARAVVHSTGPSLAYTVRRAGGPAVGFSGDTSMCPGLDATIAAADVMVCECTGWSEPAEGGHLWRGELEQLIAANPGTRFVLAHLNGRGTIPGAITAHDLLALDLVAAGAGEGTGAHPTGG